MKSPFPGMDPFLEGYLWPDVHHELASSIRAALAPQIGPKYVARIALYTVDDTSPEEDVGIMYPDVEVLRQLGASKMPFEPDETEDVAVMTPATVSIDLALSIEVRIPVVEIHDRANNQLITAIEILSPVNKRTPGLAPYRQKRQQLCSAGVHLLEIDLLRRGERAFRHFLVPRSHYVVLLTRAGATSTQAWTFNVQDRLPVLPIPLRSPDPDVLLSLDKALAEVYERGRFHFSVNYREEPPPPVFSATDSAWMRSLLEQKEP